MKTTINKQFLFGSIIIFVFVGSLMQATPLWAQFDEVSRVNLSGKVFANKEEWKGLEAKLTFQSLPDGDEIYIINSVLDSGHYKVMLQEGVAYSLAVDANGYFKHMQKIELNSDSLLDFQLRPNAVGTSLRLNINFELSQATITTDSYTELEMIWQMMQEYPKMVIQLEGHTDFRGNARANQTLSEERVEAVKDWLINREVSPHRIKLKAFGGSQPLSRENTEEGKSMNRRVEVRIIEN